MFTGIVEDLGKVESITKFDDYWSISVSSKFDNTIIGNSIAINGACLTIANQNAKSFSLRFIFLKISLSKAL